MPPTPTVPPGEMAATGGGNNSSDFVRKLFKMLEDPRYLEIVRWTDDGNSFVVLQNEKFTQEILPKHFKHGNFASFVRQLNKYDFHKVRYTEDSPAPHGTQAWEFKHPSFGRDAKDALDTIRRKAPASKQKTQTMDEGALNPHSHVNHACNLWANQLEATMLTVEGLKEALFAVKQTNKLLVEEVLAHRRADEHMTRFGQEAVNFLDKLDQERRNSKHANVPNSGQLQLQQGFQTRLPDSGDEPAPELRRAREELGNAKAVLDSHNSKELQTVLMHANNIASPPDSTTSSSNAVFNPPAHHLLQHQQSQAGVFDLAMQGLLTGDLNDSRHLVYPPGQNMGIDPFHADHVNNIPYTQPPASQPALKTANQVSPPPQTERPVWNKKPRIMLVEDDPTCSKVGTKFLHNLNCDVDLAKNGMEATEMINSDPYRYDLIFMDIIMPTMDGVSATAAIRTRNTQVPIIAMTSNIRQEDIQTD